MTDNEIIKAIEEAIDRVKTNGSIEEIVLTLSMGTVEDIIRIYNQQKAEIERLNVELVGMRGACESYKIHYDAAQEYIKSLIAKHKNLTKVNRAEAIKEFAEKLKEIPSVQCCEYEWLHLDIDNLVKEMEGESQWMKIS